MKRTERLRMQAVLKTVKKEALKPSVFEQLERGACWSVELKTEPTQFASPIRTRFYAEIAEPY